MKIIAVTQARFGSSRLPGKVLKKIKGKTLLEIHLNRALGSKCIDGLIVATTLEPEAKKICAIAASCGADFYRGSMNDVLDRFYQAVKDKNPDYVVRITSDCPLIDPELMDEMIRYTIKNKLDYCSNGQSGTFPDGTDVEVFTFKALKTAWQKAKLTSEREHVTPFIWKNSTMKKRTMFKARHFKYKKDYGKIRLTVDEPADFTLLEKLIGKLGSRESWVEYSDYIIQHPKLMAINSTITPNEGYIKSIKNDSIKTT